jgi:ribosomal protein S18 acetylase RimI-like enzyme
VRTDGSDLKVRAAQPGDLLSVLGVHARRHAGGRPPLEATKVESQTWAQMFAVPGLSVYVAEMEGDVVGTASSMIFPNVTYHCAPTAIIEAVVVAHEHRRRGVGTAMLRRMLADLRSGGCNKIQLLSHKRHSADGAHRLYSSLGFEPEAEGFRLYLGKVPDAVDAERTRAGSS